MNSYYLQQADQITPIFGVSSLEEAKRFVVEDEHCYIVETNEDVYMNPETGSVAFEGEWSDLDEVVRVNFDGFSEGWVESDE